MAPSLLCTKLDVSADCLVSLSFDLLINGQLAVLPHADKRLAPLPLQDCLELPDILCFLGTTGSSRGHSVAYPGILFLSDFSMMSSWCSEEAR